MQTVTSMLVLRHGQSEWNAVGRWQGHADPALTDRGRAQARVAAEAIGAVDVIVSSDLQRAIETAAIIAEVLGVGPVVIEPDLRERDAGEWSGLTRAEIERQWPGYLERQERPPGFEPLEPFRARIHAGFDRIHSSYHGGDVLVISHGGVLYSLEDDHGLRGGRIPNLGGRHIVHHGDRLALGDRLVLVDDAALGSVPAQD